ncbi:MAG: hypothetical protein KF758_08745 [Anaerolineales bacterium]|nr:hypothetical protein [Anaerolineales bacterium]MBX3036987.1 hypothetical protein [Anaerolineales bacterium]
MQLNSQSFYKILVSISIASFLFAIAMYMKLGTYSYYLADDYCEAVRVTRSSTVQAVIERYSDGAWRAASRYSNITFVGFSELLGENSIPITTVLMIVFYTTGLCWSVSETRKLLNINWHISVDYFLGMALAYFSLLLAPNLFQTVYWRSSMMTHFAPLAFGSLLFAFVIRQARMLRIHSIFIYAFIMLCALIISGFSEPPTTTLLTALSVLFVPLWLWNTSPTRKIYLALTLSMFIGVFLGFLFMLFSPAITNVANEKSQSIFQILITSFSYAIAFTQDSLRTVPLPLFISFLIPFLLIWSLKQVTENTIPNLSKHIPLLLILIPLITWILISAGFSPSVFGQGYPVERMRFLARLLLIITFMIEGILFGLWLPALVINRQLGIGISLIVFALVSIVYPLRTALNVIQHQIPEYSERAYLWDLRNAYIRRHATQGETDIAIVGFSGVYGIKEIDDNPNHWVNVCAANYYDINSIRAFSAKGQDIIELLSK